MPIQNVSLNTPYSAQEQEIERQRRMAEAMQAQSMQPIQGGMQGQVYVPPSWTQGAAQLAKALVGGMGVSRAGEQSQALAKQRSEAMAAALRGMPAPQTVSTTGEGMTGGLDQQDYPQGAAPGDTRTTQPTMQDNAAWLGQLSAIGPDAVGMGSALMGMQQKQQESAEQRAFRAQEGQLARDQRRQELEARMQDARASQNERLAAQKELRQMQIDAARQAQLDRVAMVGAVKSAAAPAGAGKPPTGYRFTPDGNLEAIPGGPADIKAGAEGAKAKTREQVLTDQAKNVLDTVGEAKKLTGWTTTGIGGLLANLPMTDARKLAGHVETIKSNLGFDRLQQMRDMSPTGGALGQVAVQELNALRSTVAMLDQLQRPSDVVQALDKIEKHYNRWLSTMQGNAPAAGGASGEWAIVK